MRRDHYAREVLHARTQLLPDPVGPTTLLNNSPSRTGGRYNGYFTYNITMSFSDISMVGAEEPRLILFHKSARNPNTNGIVGWGSRIEFNGSESSENESGQHKSCGVH